MKLARLVLLLGVVVALAGCTTRSSRAPVEDRRPASSSVAKSAAKPAAPPAAAAQPAAAQPAAPDGFYLVKRGDTLYSIALENGVDYRELAQWNSLEDPSRLLAGQLLRLKPQEVQVGAAHTGARIEARSLDPVPAAKVEPAAKPEPITLAKPQPKSEPAAPVAATGSGAPFAWPAKGKVIAGFAEPRKKGIDIDGKIGDPVTAAAAGRVTYVGTGIPGLGKLVVIRHDNGFITVYAHNKDILVKEQQTVARGQRIAELGNTDADRPKLHFQIRKGAEAVDPLLYLPKS